MDGDMNYNNKLHLLHIINDTQAIFEYCRIMRKEYRKALKQFDNLNEDDTRAVLKSYAKLEVSVKDEQYGIENENNNEKDDDFWDFVFEFRDIVEEDSKMLENYVVVEKEKVLARKDIEEDVKTIELNEIVENTIDVNNEFHKHGEECFETCSHAQIHSISEFVRSFLDSDDANKIRNYNPHKYDFIRKLTEPYNKIIGKDW